MAGLDLFGFLAGVSPWLWIAAGLTLAAVEMATLSFFLIWPGLAAVIVGLALFAAPDLSGTAQVLIFAGAAAGLTWAGRLWVARGGQAASGAPALNRRTARLIGRRGAVLEAFAGGEGVVEVDGLRWRARAAEGAAAEALAPPAAVRVEGADGMTLLVAPER